MIRLDFLDRAVGLLAEADRDAEEVRGSRGDTVRLLEALTWGVLAVADRLGTLLTSVEEIACAIDDAAEPAHK